MLKSVVKPNKNNILPQNIHRLPLCMSANVAGNTFERHWWSPRSTEPYTHVAFLSSGERNYMVQGQVSMEGVTKWRTVALTIPLQQAQADVQGRCHVVTAKIFDVPKLRMLKTELLAEFHVIPLLKLSILEFCHLHWTALQNRDLSSAYSVYTQLPLAGTRKELLCNLCTVAVAVFV